MIITTSYIFSLPNERNEYTDLLIELNGKGKIYNVQSDSSLAIVSLIGDSSDKYFNKLP